MTSPDETNHGGNTAVRTSQEGSTDPYQAEPDDHMCSEPVGDDGRIVCQEPVGKDNVIGGGELPDKDRRPDPAAPGGDGAPRQG